MGVLLMSKPHTVSRPHVSLACRVSGNERVITIISQNTPSTGNNGKALQQTGCIIVAY